MKFGMICLALVASTTLVFANDNGKAGRTSRLGEGCGDCHGVTASAATSVTMPGLGSSIEMTPGSSREFTIVVAHNSLAVAGIGIAVRDAADGGVNVGTLVAGTNVRLKGTTGELTHAEPVPMSGGSVSFTFTWTAPPVAGTYWVQAIGNACNGDGAEDSRDLWSWMTPVQINVTTTSGVAEHGSGGAGSLVIAPMPLMSGGVASIGGLSPGLNHIVMRDMQGRIVHQQTLDVSSGADQLPLRAPSLPSGVYGLTVTTSGRAARTTLLIE